MAYLPLGSTPCDEECAQVGDNDYSWKVRIESKRYIEQLKRQFPDWESKRVNFRIKAFIHDFGSYHEVVVDFDENDSVSVEYAYEIENNLPSTWKDGE